MIAWIREDKVLAPFRFEWMTNTEIFNDWAETYLLPELESWDVVVLDNVPWTKWRNTLGVLVFINQLELLN